MTRISKLRDLLARDPGRAAADALLAGDRARAMELFARAGEWPRAAQLAFELGEDEKLVRYSLISALGSLPEGELPEPLRAAELLVSRGHHKEAIPLFERERAYVQAGESALVLRQPLRAARYFKLAGAWMQVVRCYEEAGKLREALHAVEEGILSAERAAGGSAAGPDRVKDLNMIRAELLLRLGRGDTAAQVLGSLPPSARAAELLERGGRLAEALQCYLQLGLIDEASRVAAKSPERDRLVAQIYLHTGRASEAGDLLAQSGLPREAAEAYEKAGDWGRAAYRWEAAGEPQRAAEAYLQGGRPRDAARCFKAAGLPERAAEVTLQAGGAGPAAAPRKGRTRAVPAVPVRPPAAAKRPPAARRGTNPLDTAKQYLAQGDKSGAVAVLMRLRPNEPEFPEGTVMLAPLLLEGGFVEDALDRLRRVPPGGTPPHVEIERSYWEGRSLEAMSQNLEAVACFEQVASRDPGHRDASERLQRLRAATPAAGGGGLPGHALAVGGLLADRYEILAELGRGGMSRVYKARDRELREIVAIKTMLAPAQSNAEEEARLLREVQMCRRISHPNVVRVYDLGRFAGGLFVTMEYIEGRGLDEVIARESPLPFVRIRTVLSEIAAGLHEAHAQGIVHRDLKPANVLVTTGRVKILDFGIASMAGLGSRLTQAGFVMGSPMYMSPDQILGRELDGRSDLYSLGVLAYTLIAGREPYDLVETRVLVLKQLHDPAPDVRRLRSETPAEWVAFLDRLLAKQPGERFQSAQDVAAALARLPV